VEESPAEVGQVGLFEVLRPSAQGPEEPAVTEVVEPGDPHRLVEQHRNVRARHEEILADDDAPRRR